MTCWALIPVKAPGEGKTRLATALPAPKREMLVRCMLGHVIGTVARAPEVTRIFLVGPATHGFDQHLLHVDESAGLNGALAAALAWIDACERPPNRVIILAADLPHLSIAEVRRLAAPPSEAVVIAPDRHGIGTNALSLHLRHARRFHFQYGTDSAARHRAETTRLGLAVDFVKTPGLEFDVDEPCDLATAPRTFTR